MSRLKDLIFKYGAGQGGATAPVDLVVNGGFDTNTTGWTPLTSGVLASVAGGQAGNCLQITNGAATTGRAYNTAAIPVVVGKWYKATVWHKNGTAIGLIRVGKTNGGQDYGVTICDDANWTKREYTFQATGTEVWFTLFNNSSTVGQTTLFDSVSLFLTTAP